MFFSVQSSYLKIFFFHPDQQAFDLPLFWMSDDKLFFRLSVVLRDRIFLGANPTKRSNTLKQLIGFLTLSVKVNEKLEPFITKQEVATSLKKNSTRGVFLWFLKLFYRS